MNRLWTAVVAGMVTGTGDAVMEDFDASYSVSVERIEAVADILAVEMLLNEVAESVLVPAAVGAHHICHALLALMELLMAAVVRLPGRSALAEEVVDLRRWRVVLLRELVVHQALEAEGVAAAGQDVDPRSGTEEASAAET